MRDARRGIAVLAWMAALGLAGLVSSACGDEEGACAANGDCDLLEVCQGGQCGSVACRTNLDCPVDTICYPEEGLCGRLQCLTNFDCESIDRRSPYCIGGRCSSQAPPECSDRGQCRTGEICQSGECVGVEDSVPCDDDEDCGNPLICDPDQGEAGACVEACETDAECADGFAELRGCDHASGLCIPVDCVSAADCDEEEICADHVCEIERFPCDTLECSDPDRPFKTEPVDGMCRCVQCLSGNHCSDTNSEICSERNRCLFCETTAEGADACPDERPYFEEGCCLDCQRDADCESLGLGSVCTNGRCVVCDCERGCECPDGASCESTADGGRCVIPPGQVGDACTRQLDCDDFLACSYYDGECVNEGVGGLCSDGCPAPSRCASTAEFGSVCMGCLGDEDCPDGVSCSVREEWEGVYDGGACLPL